ncbi:MAG: pacL2 [Candidatus Saccharibacteria bacterium]|nr:pacL2 [Candidatus Saccharibacteria bacterium]
MFGFKKNNHVSTVIIDGTDVITDDQQITTTTWQQRHVPSNIGLILAKAVNMSNDTLDAALVAYVRTRGLTMPLYQPYHRIVFSRQSGISGNVWHHGSDYHIAVKGMPEKVLELCDMSENERESITTQLHAMSATGAIIVAVATGIFLHPIKHLKDIKQNDKLSFVGFVSMQVTISSEARKLSAKITTERLNVYLCTGQHQAAAYYIAYQLGIATTLADVFDNRRLDIDGAPDVRSIVSLTKVYARCMPDDRKQIFSAIKVIDPTAVIITTPDDLKKLLAK